MNLSLRRWSASFPTTGLIFVAIVALSMATSARSALSQQPGRDDRANRFLNNFRTIHAPNLNQRSHSAVKDAFRPTVSHARLSTVGILSQKRQVSLGTIIQADGMILTKASELTDRESIECILHDRSRLPAEFVAADEEYDLAVVRIRGADRQLTPVVWSEANPSVGAWIVSAVPASTPLAIGVVSAVPRTIPTPRALLGVELGSSEQGPRILRVVASSGAERAELLVGDTILSIDDFITPTPQSVEQRVSRRRPGDRITLEVLRQDVTLSLQAVLGAAEDGEQAEMMESLGGPLSNRRHGFPVVLQHDTVLLPKECGGPLVTLDGQVIGVNIARASRVATYALPASTLRSVLVNLVNRRAEVLVGGTPQK